MIMAYQITVSPDFTPDHISGWYIFNTWLQKAMNLAVHLELYDSFSSQRIAISEDRVDMIYANPFDAAMLVREKGFLPVARPRKYADEAVIAVHKDYQANRVEELPTTVSIAATEDPDVNLICAIMLEPAEVNVNKSRRVIKNSYPLVAKTLIQGEAEVGFFLMDAYTSLSSLTKKQLRQLVSSQIQVIHHALLIGPRLAELRDTMRDLLIGMSSSSKGYGVLSAMGLSAWEGMDYEEMEFMIDLMDTLNFQPE
jgi:phosphonate transport system substrate-binding protein